MFKKGRIYIYILITLLLVFYNFLYEITTESWDEAIFETLILFPCIFLFVTFIYQLRLVALRNKTIYNLLTQHQYSKLYLIVIIFIKSTFITMLARAVANWAFNDDEVVTFFDLVFGAIFIATTVIVAFVYFFEHFINVEENKHRIELQLSRHESEKFIAKYLSLKKQLNPHFLFNSFNSLISLISLDAKKAEDFVEELSSIYRYNLLQSDEVVVPLYKELNMITSYIHLQKIRFGSALNYHELVSPTKHKLLLPPMTLQLLVENAIKHNIVSTQKPLNVTIKIDQDYIIVENNLQLKDKQKHSVDSLGIGIQNLENQIALISDEKLQVEVTNSHYKVYVPLIKGDLDD